MIFLPQVERLVDRVNNSTLLEDRRDACRALKAMSRTYRVEVGAQGMDTLKQVSLPELSSDIIIISDRIQNNKSRVVLEKHVYGVFFALYLKGWMSFGHKYWHDDIISLLVHQYP